MLIVLELYFLNVFANEVHMPSFDNIKLLGVIFDSMLSVELHVRSSLHPVHFHLNQSSPDNPRTFTRNIAFLIIVSFPFSSPTLTSNVWLLAPDSLQRLLDLAFDSVKFGHKGLQVHYQCYTQLFMIPLILFTIFF